MPKLQPAVIIGACGVAIGLSAWGLSLATNRGSTSTSSGSVSNTAELSLLGSTDSTGGSDSRRQTKVASTGSTLADGPDVCFRAIAKQFGADARVSEITSFFSAGSEIDSSMTHPQGEMIICKVEYQNPQDPRKLLSAQMDVKSGIFGEPRPVEITVAGGNAATFNLEDYLIPLSKVNAAALTSVMDAEKAKLGNVYSRYAWSGIRLTSPGAFSNTHNLRLDLTGRLASNDIKEDGYASVAIDGKTIKANYLVP